MNKFKILLIFMLYFIHFDESGYITDLTRFNPGRPTYTAHDIDPKQIPTDVLRGYYKLKNGQFVLDEARKAQWEAENPEPEEGVY